MSSLFQQVKCDSQLAIRISQRDESALGEVIGLYGPQVQAVCMRICADLLDAEGVVSQVFWELWNSAHKYDAQRGSLRAYLLTLARSRAIDRERANAALYRKTTAETSVYTIAQSSRVVSEDPCEREIMKERKSEIRQALKQLTVSQQDALELAFFDGLTHPEVAAKLHLPLGTVKTNIRRGLLQLREYLAEMDTRGKLA
ncbi:MAG: sigma-70 family RNA polymerase sigma factor [Aureliella sp.]